MTKGANTDIESLGRVAAEEVAGKEAVEGVEVTSGYEFDRPVYRFTFLIDQSRAKQRAGLVRTRLIQKLRDALDAREDERHPMIRILDRLDWDQHRSA